MSHEPFQPAAITSIGPSPDGLPALRDVIRTHGLNAKKSLGQNFILDFNLTRAIARLSGPLDGRTVVEVGPGPGGLTRALLLEGAGRVIAIERDDRCLAALAEISERYPGRLIVEPDDATRTNWRALLSAHSGNTSERAVIAANLPYGIATVLLIDWLEAEPWPPWWDRMTLMFQKEVAERITAKPRTEHYGRLALLVHWRCDARIVLTLPPEAFTPAPKVHSAVVHLTRLEVPRYSADEKTLLRITAQAFGQRRKMLRSSLKGLLPDLEAALESVGIPPTARAEEIGLEAFCALARLVKG